MPFDGIEITNEPTDAELEAGFEAAMLDELFSNACADAEGWAL